MTGPAGPGGRCDARFTAVRDAFAANFAERGEAGAAACLVWHGTVVADLWGGRAGPGPGAAPWRRDTLVNVFSAGKGLVAACAARLIGQRRLDPDAPVARYWPEFGAAGKSAVTLRQLLSHQAGLPALRDPLPDDGMFDWPVMTAALAAEAPWWPPGTGHGYHVNTFGFLAGEVIRRVTGMTVGAMLRQEIAGPLGADVHIGLPATEHARVAEFAWPRAENAAAAPGVPAPAAALGVPAPAAAPGNPAPALAREHMIRNAYFNPAGMSGLGVVNTAAWRAAEVPSANAHASAAGVARVYAALAGGGAVDGLRVVDSGALADAVTEQVCGDDLVLGRPSRFGLGFQLTQPERPLGPGPRAFGHFGAGGSVGLCDPDAGVAFGYVTSEMGPRWRNPRNRALIDAVFACL
ncbi:MAG TPA: serine hydrolase domain-containing protein [Streptosporangiaceae bacterium]|nr:serine hydrolase domain-containing protein [Streptosporangiaceae bacterium]